MAMPNQLAHDVLAMIEYRDDPSILVLADTAERAADARRMVERAGYRVQAAVGIEEGEIRLAEQIALDGVFLDIGSDQGAALDRLLAQLDHAAAAGRFGSVVAVPPELIDIVSAAALRGDVVHLVAPREGEIGEALDQATKRTSAWLHDVGKGGPPIRLQQLSEEVGRIANILATLSENEPGLTAEDGAEASVTAQQVRAIIRARRLRDQYFGSDLFADPAWDMLLDLMAARLEQQRVAVSSLCIAAAVPATTALRWIKALTEHGLFVRSADPQDGRRVYIELSEGAAAALAAYLRAAQRLSPLLT